MEQLAQAIKLAMKYREDSYDKKGAAAISSTNNMVNFNKFYQISLMEAANMAAADVGYDSRGRLPIYLLIKCCWNDILEWAE